MPESQLEVCTSMRRSLQLTMAMLAMTAMMLVLSASASALTLGVGWSGNPSLNEPEMLQVGKSGASTFRVPMPPENNNDGTVRAAAENGITIHAGLNGGGPLPTGAARTTFINLVRNEVKRYGYSGEFWAANPGLPYKPITTWEVWNEPNSLNIAPAEYGVFLSEVASAIQTASNERAGRGTDVLFGGLLAMGNLGKTVGNWMERGPVSYMGALQYLQEAYPYIKSSSDVTGVAIHPYELDPETFYQPSGKPRYDRIEAFKYAVFGFHTKLVELGQSAQKSLWITEAGWPAEGPQYSVGSTEQASLLKQAIDYARNNETTLNLKDFLWYNIRDRSGTSVWDDFCGLRAHDESYRPSWVAFQEAAGASKWPLSPTVASAAATGVTEQQAVLNGTVNPNGLQASYHFEYGETTSYGNSIPVPDGSAGSGGSAIGVQTAAHGLLPHTRYHYRIVATNQLGASYGADRTFTTGLRWNLRNSNSSGGADKSFWFGLPGETKVSGDWDGDGVVTVGTYDQSTGNWKLRNSNTTGGADVTVQYGGNPWIPVTGDWDGNGTTTIGLYDPSTGTWRLRNKNSPGPAEKEFQYGGSQFTPVTGDWDGNGTTTIGLYEKSAGTWRLRNKNSAGSTEVEFQYGGGAWNAVTGDWDGSGGDTVGVVIH